MRFTNLTPFPARFEAGSPTDREMIGCIACKVTYLVDRGSLVPVPEDERWPVFDKPFVHEGVRLGPDADFRREGVDVVVFGKAMAPGGVAAPHVFVSIECGTIRHQVWVIGDRRWTRVDGGLRATDPEPFVEMPLTNDRAFGGKATTDGMELPHPTNPAGKGFCLTEGEAAERPLPNLEWPEDRLMRWNDRPQPACFFKPKGFLDPERGEPEGFTRRLARSSFQQAVPSLVAERPEDLGSVMTLTGFDFSGPLAIPVPPSTGPAVHVSVGPYSSRFHASMSSLVVLADARVVIVTYRALFRYLFRPEERRSAELRWDTSADA